MTMRASGGEQESKTFWAWHKRNIAQERDYVSSTTTTRQHGPLVKSMARLHFSKINGDNARCNICDAKSKAGQSDTSNPKKHLVKNKIYLKAEDCTIFESLKANA